MEDQRNLLINLLGSTYSELKKVENSVVDGSGNLRGRSDNIKSEIHKIISTPQQSIQQENVEHQHAAIPQQPELPPQQMEMVSSGSDPYQDSRQLTFNFNPDEKEILFKKVEVIDKKLEKIITLLNECPD